MKFQKLRKILLENKIRHGYFHAALIGYCLFIFILSSLPGDNLPDVDFKYSDKYVHLAEYGILCILFFYSLKNQSKYAKLKKFAPEYSVLFTAMFGLTDEIHQYFVPKRSCELFDWFADVIGALLIYMIIKIQKHKQRVAASLILMIVLAGSSCTGSLKKDNNYKISITEQEAWIDLMPVVDVRQNNFGFALGVKIENFQDDKNLSIKDLVIYLNNDTLKNKNFETEISKTEKDVSIKIFQIRDEMYLDKNKPLPEEAQFIFRIYKNDVQIKRVKTSQLNINKVY